jgi:hypothetical protein
MRGFITSTTATCRPAAHDQPNQPRTLLTAVSRSPRWPAAAELEAPDRLAAILLEELRPYRAAAE